MEGTDCPFCDVSGDRMLAATGLCYFMDTGDPVLAGSGMIIPRAHRESVFDLTEEEWQDTFSLLHKVRRLLDKDYGPDGYSVGWNCGEAAGQEVSHSHLHVIPRFSDEPLAGRGIRYHIKQPENRRPGT